MSVLSLVSAYGFIMVAAWLGVRLLLMWRQTRKLPELLFGMSFALSMVGTSLYVLRSRHAGLFPSDVIHILWLSNLLFNALVGINSAKLPWRLFRRDRGWAKALVALVTITLVGHYVGACTGYTYGLGRWAESVGAGSPRVSMAIESFRYHRLLQRRLRLGLTDPG